MKQLRLLLVFLLIIGLSVGIYKSAGNKPQSVSAQTQENPQSVWSMAGANPQRTSWVSSTTTNQTEIPGSIQPEWYMPIGPYISQKTQIVFGNDTMFVSTSRGLYAFNPDAGNVYLQNPNDLNKPWIKWVYPTEMPISHSPTYYNGRVYVGGLDRKIHAIDATTGQGIWTHQTEGGFQTNPLVVDINGKTMIFMGNRAGIFYAVEDTGSQPRLAWKYPLSSKRPILFSAALSFDSSKVYFASEDSSAYALNSTSGQLVWKSQKFPGGGFHSWWPAVYKDQMSGKEYVIFGGSENYVAQLNNDLDNTAVYPFRLEDTTVPDIRGPLIGPLAHEPTHPDTYGNWVSQTPYIDMSRSETVVINSNTTPLTRSTNPTTEYLEQQPYRRTYFVLDGQSGIEYTFPYQRRDGLTGQSYAPILWFNTHSGNRYPAMVGSDGVLYQTNNYMYNKWIPAGQVSGWKFGTPYIGIVSADWGAVDEPHAYAGGGDIIYWNLCCGDRELGSYNIKSPMADALTNYQTTGRIYDHRDGTREWFHMSYNYDTLLPNYKVLGNQSNPDPLHSIHFGKNGYYWSSGDNNPPVPYKGRIYIHRANNIIAFSPYQGGRSATLIPQAEYVQASSTTQTPPSQDSLKTRLRQEIQAILDAGHLKPGYYNHGLFDGPGESMCSDKLVDYFHNTSETLVALIKALPFVPPVMQDQIFTYLANEYSLYPPQVYNHNGFKDGAQRTSFEIPPEVLASHASNEKSMINGNFQFSGGWNSQGVWGRNPYTFYALSLYVQALKTYKKTDIAPDVYNSSRNAFFQEFDSQAPDTVINAMPFVHNAYIAGYQGFIKLVQDSGVNEPRLTEVQTRLTDLLTRRAANFTTTSAYNTIQDWNPTYCKTLNNFTNFWFMTPELEQYLRNNALTKVQDAVNEYNYFTPFWFVSFAEEAYGESNISPLQTTFGLFQAKAQILQEPYEELVKYLDVPGFPIGDLYYIQNLISTIEASSSSTCTLVGDIDCSGVVNVLDLSTLINKFGGSDSSADLDNSGKVNVIDLSILLSNFGRSN